MTDKLSSPRVVRETLTALGAEPSKALGQNFLIDANIVEILIRTAEVKPTDAVLEIGPGLGVLTDALAARAGTVVAPSVSILPGTQYVMPISRFVAVSLRPASSVRRRTFASTGSVLRLETALETTERPRARFSCMTESFTSGCLQQRLWAGDWRAAGRGWSRCLTTGSLAPRGGL